LKTQMKASIARNMWDNSKYYQILNPAMPFFDRVIQVIEDGELYSEAFGNGE